MAQFKALMAVERSSGISVCELGRELGIGESAASLLVEQLVRRDYLGRTSDPADRRRVLLGATAQSHALLRSCATAAVRPSRSGFPALPTTTSPPFTALAPLSEAVPRPRTSYDATENHTT